ncbi:hypothetical protein [Luteolibacter marinus]|uniref:hypothetical protein n=1 Tax=Luteolibacter marinus TaxID=2776705 RepID=UPI001D026DB4|nr:hypothetical protein [Luteolibacter marinus]
MNGGSSTRRYVTILFLGIAAATLIAAAVNTRVDPWRVTRSPWADPALEPFRDISGSTRTGKAGLVRARDDWQIGIFGSSRVISSIDPQAAGWDGRKVVNLGMPGAFLYESIAMAEYFIAHQPAETVLFGIDPGDLTSPIDTRPMSDFMSSPLNPNGALDRELRYVVGLSTFEESMETLGLRAKNRPGEYNPLGFRDRPGHATMDRERQLKFIKGRFVDDARLASDVGKTDRVNPDKAARLEDLMSLCRRKGIRLVLFLHPNHVLLQAKSADAGHPEPPFGTDLRALAGMVAAANALPSDGPPVALWDFYSYHPINSERVRPLTGEPSDLIHWRDLEHFTKDVGDGMLSLMMSWPVANPDLRHYGEQVTPENVEARIEALRVGYRDYLAREMDGDIAWKEQLIRDAQR